MEIKKVGSVFRVTSAINNVNLLGTVTKYDEGDFYMFQLTASMNDIEIGIYSSVDVPNKVNNLSFSGSDINLILQNLPNVSEILMEMINTIKTINEL